MHIHIFLWCSRIVQNSKGLYSLLAQHFDVPAKTRCMFLSHIWKNLNILIAVTGTGTQFPNMDLWHYFHTTPQCHFNYVFKLWENFFSQLLLWFFKCIDERLLASTGEFWLWFSDKLQLLFAPLSAGRDYEFTSLKFHQARWHLLFKVSHPPLPLSLSVSLSFSLAPSLCSFYTGEIDLNFNLPAQCHSICLWNEVKELKLFYRINTRGCNVIKAKYRTWLILKGLKTFSYGNISWDIMLIQPRSFNHVPLLSMWSLISTSSFYSVNMRAGHKRNKKLLS